ncbi:MAG: Tm-1-like ATP-binding domain-containing protein, partial [Thermoleophilia bacterium]|nr:Tm-1-like ATP-binding domain-containing protein [Thermoleophilia bacterium]
MLLGTLDTKGAEYAYLRDRINDAGADVDVVVVDAGILGEPLVEPDVTRQEVAVAAGADVQALADVRDRANAIETMGRGAAVVVQRLHEEGRLDALGALGGTGGTAIATRAMRALPVGVPKLMVSTVAAGDMSPYVGTTDVTMMHSVVDVAGINRISARIFTNAARALTGMAVGTESPPVAEKPLVVASMWGVTTPCVTTARERLEELGYDVLVFHQTGTGGRSMEELIAAGLVDGVLDVTTTELADEL